MRSLRVLGLADGDQAVHKDAGTKDAGTRQAGTKSVIMEDPSTGELFSTRCDDRLLAAARGDLSRFGQLEIELESQLRPKEIQARIRAGATVEQVAAAAGTSITRVERFAYPVLLERASLVERAKKARPAIDGITAGASVADTVAATLAARGHDADISWDAHREDDGWILTLRWSAGRSENSAHWLFHPGPDGGTLSARDDAAAEIVDPALRILRPLRPVRAEGQRATIPPGETAGPGAADGPLDATVAAEHRSAEAASRSAHPAGGKIKPTGEDRPGDAGADRIGTPSGPPLRPGAAGPRQGGGSTRFGRHPQPTSRTGTAAVAQGNAERLVADLLDDPRAGALPEMLPVGEPAARTGTEHQPGSTITSAPVGGQIAAAARTAGGAPPRQATVPAVQAGVTAAEPAVTPSPVQPPAPNAPRPQGTAPVGRSGKRGQRPAMPSWEDVLLGTRSTGR